MVALAESIGAEQAVNVFFDVLDRKVEMNKSNKILRSFFKEVRLNPGDYENYRYSNEDIMKKMLVAKIEAIMNQPRIL